MTIQTSLFDVPIPASRLNSPLSSIMAEDNLNASGGMASMRTKIYLALKDNPKKTAVELAEITGISRYDYSRRLPELEKLGFVKRNCLRSCTINGNLMAEWEATV